MAYSRLALFVLYLTTVAHHLFAQSQPHAGPLITFEKTLHDFGRLVEGPSAEYAFKFTNTGDEPLIIQSCSTSDPHTASWPKEPVLPGKEGKIVVTMPTRGRRGSFEKNVRIRYNVGVVAGEERDIPTETLVHIKGVIEADSVHEGLINPASVFVHFDTVEAGSIVTQAFRCSNAGKIAFRITGLESTSVYRGVRYEELFRLGMDDGDLLPGDTAALRLTLDARNAQLGELSALLHLRISNGDGCTVYVSGWVQPADPQPERRR